MYSKTIRKIAVDKTLGYEYFMDKDHPLASPQGRVYYHRHVASIKIGRWMEYNEVVHHIDGNKKNNSPENLEVLQNEAHALLHKPENRILITCTCGKLFKGRPDRSKYCSPVCCCLAKREFNPTKEELERMVWKMPSTKVGEAFGVSDKAIEKRCKLFGISKPPRGYWAKQQSSQVPMVKQDITKIS
jgi:hypothetical protein